MNSNVSTTLNMAGEISHAVATLSLYSRLEDLPESATRLLEQGQSQSLQLGPAWLQLQERHIHCDTPSSVVIAVLSRHQQPQVVLPLISEETRLGRRLRSLTSFYTALYAPAVHPDADDGALAETLRLICRALFPVRSLLLSPLSQAVASRCLQATQTAGMSSHPYFTFANWSTGSWNTSADYFASLSGNLRSTVNRSRKRLQAAGGRVMILKDIQDVEAGMDAYEQVYELSWKQPEPYPEFLRAMARQSAAEGGLRLGLCLVEDRPIAAQLWTVHQRVAEIHKLAYDEACKELGAGTVLTADLMAHVIDQDRVVKIDYLIGDDDYKKRWMSQRVERLGVAAYPNTTIGGFIDGTFEGVKRNVKTILGGRSRPTRSAESKGRSP